MMHFQEMEGFWKAAGEAVRFYFPEGARSLRLLYRSENASFALLDRDGIPREVLRAVRPGYHTTEEVDAETRWLEALSGNPAIHTAPLVRTPDGRRWTAVTVDGCLYICTLSVYLSGCHPAPRSDGDAEKDFFETGRLAAFLHNQTEMWQESRTLSRPVWDYEALLGRQALFGDWRQAELTDGQRELLERTCGIVRDRLHRLERTEDNYGLIHGDLRAANLLKQNGVLQVLDFDDCGFGWHLFDLAASLSFLLDDPRLGDWVHAWICGYRTVRPTDERDVAEIPTFLMARQMQLMAWTVSHRDSDPVKDCFAGFAEQTVRAAEAYVKWVCERR